MKSPSSYLEPADHRPNHRIPPARGLSIVEIVVAAAIIAAVVTALSGAWQLYIRTSTIGSEMSEAALMTEEAAEALETIRDAGWTASIAPLATDGTYYYVAWNSATERYGISSTYSTPQSGYARTITLATVMRDSNSNIVSAFGTNDPKTRKATISVFLVGATSTPLMQSDMYIHNVFNN